MEQVAEEVHFGCLAGPSSHAASAVASSPDLVLSVERLVRPQPSHPSTDEDGHRLDGKEAEDAAEDTKRRNRTLPLLFHSMEHFEYRSPSSSSPTKAIDVLEVEASVSIISSHNTSFCASLIGPRFHSGKEKDIHVHAGYGAGEASRRSNHVESPTALLPFLRRRQSRTLGTAEAIHETEKGNETSTASPNFANPSPAAMKCEVAAPHRGGGDAVPAAVMLGPTSEAPSNISSPNFPPLPHAYPPGNVKTLQELLDWRARLPGSSQPLAARRSFNEEEDAVESGRIKDLLASAPSPSPAESHSPAAISQADARPARHVGFHSIPESLPSSSLGAEAAPVGSSLSSTKDDLVITAGKRKSNHRPSCEEEGYPCRPSNDATSHLGSDAEALSASPSSSIPSSTQHPVSVSEQETTISHDAPSSPQLTSRTSGASFRVGGKRATPAVVTDTRTAGRGCVSSPLFCSASGNGSPLSASASSPRLYDAGSAYHGPSGSSSSISSSNNSGGNGSPLFNFSLYRETDRRIGGFGATPPWMPRPAVSFSHPSPRVGAEKGAQSTESLPNAGRPLSRILPRPHPIRSSTPLGTPSLIPNTSTPLHHGAHVGRPFIKSWGERSKEEEYPSFALPLNEETNKAIVAFITSMLLAVCLSYIYTM